MLMQTAGNGYFQKCRPFLAFCPKCKDRVRFDVGQPALVVCNCRVDPKYGPNNVIRFTEIHARVTGHKCDARCTNAIGGKCECSCGGKNHGTGH